MYCKSGNSFRLVATYTYSLEHLAMVRKLDVCGRSLFANLVSYN